MRIALPGELGALKDGISNPAFRDKSAAVRWLDSRGLLNVGDYVPDAPITRATVAVWMWRIAGRHTPTEVAPVPDVRGEALDALSWLSEIGVHEDASITMFRPHARLTRQGYADWLDRFVKAAFGDRA